MIVHILGWALLALPFLVILGFFAVELGWLVTAALWGATLAIVGLVMLGARLAFGSWS